MNQGLPNRKPRAIAVRITAEDRKVAATAKLVMAASLAAAITEAVWLIQGLLQH